MFSTSDVAKQVRIPETYPLNKHLAEETGKHNIDLYFSIH